MTPAWIVAAGLVLLAPAAIGASRRCSAIGRSAGTPPTANAVPSPALGARVVELVVDRLDLRIRPEVAWPPIRAAVVVAALALAVVRPGAVLGCALVACVGSFAVRRVRWRASTATTQDWSE